MRSIWLASAAIIMTAGIAAAQSTSPAPTGATNAPTETPAGSAASPGNTGTSNNAAGPTAAMTAPAGASTASASSPAPTGAPQSPESSPNPNISPGNLAPGGTTNAASANPTPATDSSTPSSSTTAAPAATMASSKPVHHGMGGMMVPENASTDRYLHIASDAIKHHNKGVADDALSHAETRLLTRAVPASAGVTQDDSPRVSAIENARKALSSGDYQTAADDTRQAMHGHMGGMGHMDSGMNGGMSAPTTTSDTPMPGTPLSSDSASGSSAGNGK